MVHKGVMKLTVNCSTVVWQTDIAVLHFDEIPKQLRFSIGMARVSMRLRRLIPSLIN